MQLNNTRILTPFLAAMLCLGGLAGTISVSLADMEPDSGSIYSGRRMDPIRRSYSGRSIQERIDARNAVHGMGQVAFETIQVDRGPIQKPVGLPGEKSLLSITESLKRRIDAVVERLKAPEIVSGKLPIPGQAADSRRPETLKTLKTVSLEQNISENLMNADEAEAAQSEGSDPNAQENAGRVEAAGSAQAAIEEEVSEAIKEWEKERREKDAFVYNKVQAEDSMNQLKTLLKDFEVRWGQKLEISKK